MIAFKGTYEYGQRWLRYHACQFGIRAGYRNLRAIYSPSQA